MKNPLASAASVFAAVTLMTACLGASAIPGEDDPLAAVSAATAAVDTAAAVPTHDTGEDAINATLAGVDLAVPVDPEAGIDLGAGSTEVGIGLPFGASADSAEVEKPGVVSYDNNNGSWTVPVVSAEGALQVNTVIDSADAPQRYSYPMDLPNGDALRLADDGSAAVVDAAGDTVVRIGAPWAKDADGNPVRTRYEVSGNTLTQVVEHREEALAYPVVADPTYYVYTIMLSRTDVEQMWKSMNNIGNVCRWLPLPYWYSVACAPPAPLANAISQAHYQKKRIKALYHLCDAGGWCTYYTYQVVA